MNIIQALQNKNNNLRISYGSRWLVGDGNDGWIIYERTHGAKKTKTIIETGSEELAVEKLLE